MSRSAWTAVFVVVGSQAALAQAPLGTAFTYQGRLTDSSTPAAGTYDFRFSLHTASAGGTQRGPTLFEEDIPVVGGLFSIALDFGPGVFAGSALWLEIGVRAGSSTGPFTVLGARQEVTPTPNAIFSTFSATAGAVPWGSIQQLPPTLADNVDNDTLASLPCAEGQVPTWRAAPAGWICGAGSTPVGSSQRGIVVVAKSGGHFSSIQAALDSISDNAADKTYLVRVAPGVYNERVTMKPYVDIEGAGRGTVRITAPPSGSRSTGTLNGASDAEARFLSVEVSGSGAAGAAVASNGGSPSLTHVSVIASVAGGEAYGIVNLAGSPTQMEDIAVSATSSGAASYGIYSESSSPEIRRATVVVSGPTSVGILNDASTTRMTDVTIEAGQALVAGDATGVWNRNSSFATMVRIGISLRAGGRGGAGWGVRSEGSALRAELVDIAVGCSDPFGACPGGMSFENACAKGSPAVRRTSISVAGGGISSDCGRLALSDVDVSTFGYREAIRGVDLDLDRVTVHTGYVSAGNSLTMKNTTSDCLAGACVYLQGGTTLEVVSSQVLNEVSGGASISNASDSPVQIAGSRLGGAVGGPATCAFTVNRSLQPLTADCQ